MNINLFVNFLHVHPKIFLNYVPLKYIKSVKHATKGKKYLKIEVDYGAYNILVTNTSIKNFGRSY